VKTSRQRLRRPPVVEAIVDIRAKTDLSEDGLRTLGADLQIEFPKLKVMKSVRTSLEVKDGKLVPPPATPIQFAGVHVLSEDETRVAQFRPDGFTFNNLRRYIGGDELLSTSIRLWNRFVESAKPAAPTRIAMRYINRLELPLTEGVDLDTYLTLSPQVPDHVPSVAQFLTQVVAHNVSEPGVAVLTQRLFLEDSKPIVILDIDTILEGDVVVGKFTVPEALSTLRALANRSFFSLITEETAKLYD